MTQKNKLYLMYGGALIIGSGIAFWIYSANKKKLSLVDNGKVSNDDETITPKSTKSNYFASLLDKTIPSSIDYKFGSSTKL